MLWFDNEQGSDKLQKQQWYIFYTEYLYDWSRGFFNNSFKKECSVAFDECPALVERIQNDKYKAKDVVEIVTEFNKDK